MEWIDDGIVLAVRPHGESAAVASLLTREHGRHAGLVRGGAGRRYRPVLQPGNRVHARWRGRLSEHLGTYTIELAQAAAAELFDSPAKLAALASACALAEAALPEREPHPTLYAATAQLLDALLGDSWARAYVHWEVRLLAELGFGLDLEVCAATGANDGLVYVSPRTGRAVSASAGEPWRDKLLALPAFLREADATADSSGLAQGLALTGHFLETHVFAHRPKGMPAARQRLIDRLGNQE